VAIILRPGKTPDGTEVTLVLRHVIGRIRARWPAVDIVVRGDSHYARVAAPRDIYRPHPEMRMQWVTAAPDRVVQELLASGRAQ
jgi:Transposase DDE domain group 1